MPGANREDRTGRSSIARNVLWSWGGYLIIFVIGFLMPRMIDEFVGQANLGIWDFGWSVVSYLGLSSFGIGSAVNRYVAKFRASSDFEKLSETINSVLAVQIVVALFIIVGAVAVASILPHFFSKKLGPHIHDAQLIIVTLATSVAVQQLFHVFRGVMTGYHRWDIHNLIEVFLRIITFVSIFWVLKSGFGLPAMALAYLGSVVIAENIRFFLARRICKDFKLGVRYVTWNQTKKMIFFGWKTVLATLSPIILLQTANVLVAKFMGPESLAILSRSCGLLTRTETFVNRYSFITTPVAGSLQALNDNSALEELIVESARFVAALVIPVTLIFVFCGKAILAIWMGADYAKGSVLAIMAAGYFFSYTQSPLLRIIIGLNLHGRLGILNLSISIAIFLLVLLFITFNGWSLNNAALLIAIPMGVGNGILIPFYAKRALNLSLIEYIKGAYVQPLLCNLPFLILIYFLSNYYHDQPYKLVILTGLLGIPLIFWQYWLHLLSPQVKSKLKDKISGLFNFGRKNE